jgi:hypothetical protein
MNRIQAHCYVYIIYSIHAPSAFSLYKNVSSKKYFVILCLVESKSENKSENKSNKAKFQL